MYILDSKITEEKKKKLESISEVYERNPIIWVPAKDISEELQMDVSVDRGSLSQYARLFISSVLPDNLNRILYLDCDIILNQSLEELWNIDMQGKTLAALKDAFSSWYRMNIDLKPKDIMFNSGVMLIDARLYKERGLEGTILWAMRRIPSGSFAPDQDVLNALYDAVGVRFYKTPVRPEDILSALREKEGNP